MNRVRSLSLAAVLLATSLVPAASVVAQDDAPAGDRATSFHAVTGGEHEDVPGGNLLVGAYAVALVALVGYVLYVGMIQQGTQRDLARLERLVNRASSGTSGRSEDAPKD